MGKDYQDLCTNSLSSLIASYDLSTMAWFARFSFLLLLTGILHLANPSVAGVLAPIQKQTDEVPSELFDSIEELSRLVNIAYCVGWSGIQPPFQCLSDCDEFKGFELVTVSINIPTSSRFLYFIFGI